MGGNGQEGQYGRNRQDGNGQEGRGQDGQCNQQGRQGQQAPRGRQGRSEGEGLEPLLPKHGGYRRLKSFQVAQLVYDVTVRFCDRFIDRRSRTHDQMVQAARSGVQNIAEGSVASGTSKKTELKLTNVAKASLEELRLDYEDFLRQRGATLWAPEDPRRRALVDRRCTSADDVARWVKSAYDQQTRTRVDGRNGRNGPHGQDGPYGPHGPDGPAPCAETAPSIASMKSIESMESIPSMESVQAIAANAALVLVGVATALLSRQIATLASAFENEGGFTERLYRVRRARRDGR